MGEPRVVALVVHTFDVGGLERCVCHIANRLDRRHWQPIIVCLNRTGTAASWLIREDVRVLEIGSKGGSDWRACLRFAKLLRDERVAVVQSHNWGTLVETEVARRRAGVPVHVHGERGTVMGGATGSSPLHRWARAAAMRWTLRACNATIAVAESVRERLETMSGYPASRVGIYENGVEPPPRATPEVSRKELRARLGIADEAIVIGSVGRLVPVKNFESLMTATLALIRNAFDVHLVLVGDGSEFDALTEQAKPEGSGRIHLVGLQSNVGDWMRSFDIYVNCSLSEGMSQSVLEAMSCGLPLIVTDAGDNRILVEGCGDVVPVGDSDALGARIGAMCRDSSVRSRFGEAARARHASRYSMERMIARYEQLYTRLLSNEACEGSGSDGH